MSEDFKRFYFLVIIPATLLVFVVMLFGLILLKGGTSDKEWATAVETQAMNILETVMIRSGAESYKCFTDAPQLTKESLYVGQGYCYSKKEGIFLESSLTYTVERNDDLENIKLELVRDATIINGYTKI